MNEIIPAIIPKGLDDLKEKVSLLGGAEPLVHIDVLTETFVPSGPLELGVEFEAHFMLPNPLEAADKWLEAGAKRIIIHAEAFADDSALTGALAQLRSRAEVGLAVELLTPLEKIFPHVAEADFVQLMSIAVVGEQGHPFDERIFDRIKTMKEKFPETIISVDGGVSDANIERLAEAGASRFVSGSAIFGNL